MTDKATDALEAWGRLKKWLSSSSGALYGDLTGGSCVDDLNSIEAALTATPEGDRGRILQAILAMMERSGSSSIAGYTQQDMRAALAPAEDDCGCSHPDRHRNPTRQELLGGGFGYYCRYCVKHRKPVAPAEDIPAYLTYDDLHCAEEKLKSIIVLIHGVVDRPTFIDPAANCRNLMKLIQQIEKIISS